MKKIIIIAALLIAGLSVPELANSSNTNIESIATQSTITVPAVKRLSNGGKIRGHKVTVYIDEGNVYVQALNNKYLSNPVKATYDGRTFPDYPYRVYIDGQTYYFAID